MRALAADGCLTVEDVAAAGAARSHQRGATLRRDLKTPERWWQAMAYYNALTRRAEHLLGASPKEARELSWDFDPEQRYGIQGSDGLVHDLAAVLADAGNSDLDAHRELFGTAVGEVRRHLREVNSCLVACDELGVAPMVWAPYRRYLEAKLATPGGLQEQSAAEEFFTIAFPAYAPTTVREFEKMRSAGAIADLRSEILRATETGDALDPEYPQRVLTEVLRLQVRGARVRRIVGWISTIVGAIPVPGVGLAASAAAEGVTALLDRKRRKAWRWFYVVSDGRGVT